MTQHVIPFAFEDQLVRVVMIDGDDWYVGRDCCHALGIRDHKQALSRLDEDERGTCIVGTPSAAERRGGYDVPPPSGRNARDGGPQETIIISEAGLYRLIFSSRKPEAERFKRWLAHEVLPILRRTGSYAMPSASAEGGTDAQTPFRLWPPAVQVTYVREMRLAFGPQRTALIIPELGLPVPPELPADPTLADIGDDSRAVLEAILNIIILRDDSGAGQHLYLHQAALIAMNETDGKASYALKEWGVLAPVTHRGEDGLAIANGHPKLRLALMTTRWADRYWYALRQLPGCRAWKGLGTKPLMPGMGQARMTFVSERWLDPALRDPRKRFGGNIVPFKPED